MNSTGNKMTRDSIEMDELLKTAALATKYFSHRLLLWQGVCLLHISIQVAKSFYLAFPNKMWQLPLEDLCSS